MENSPWTEPPLSADLKLADFRLPTGRLWSAFTLMIVAAFCCPMDYDHRGEMSIWARFWLGAFSGSAAVTLLPAFFRSKVWQKVLAGVILIWAVLRLIEAFSYLSINL